MSDHFSHAASGLEELPRDRIIEVDLSPSDSGGILRNGAAQKRIAVTALDATGWPTDAVEGRPIPHATAWVQFDASADAAGTPVGAPTTTDRGGSPAERLALPAIVIHARRKQEAPNGVRAPYPNPLTPGQQPIVSDLSTPFTQIEGDDATSGKATGSTTGSSGLRVVDGRLCLLGIDPLETDPAASTGGAQVTPNLQGSLGIAWSGVDGEPGLKRTVLVSAFAPLRRGAGTPLASFGVASGVGSGGGGGAGGSGGAGGGAGGGAADASSAVTAALAEVSKADQGLQAADANLQAALRSYEVLPDAQGEARLSSARTEYQDALTAALKASDDYYIAMYELTYGASTSQIANFAQASAKVREAGKAVVDAYNALVAANARVLAVRSHINSMSFAAYAAALTTALADQARAQAALNKAIAALRALGVQIEQNGGTFDVGSAPTAGVTVGAPQGSTFQAGRQGGNP